MPQCLGSQAVELFPCFILLCEITESHASKYQLKTEPFTRDFNKNCTFVFQCQVGVLPLGTGNDLARVLGWGSVFDDETQIQIILEKMEHAQIKMLDRWSIMTYEGTMPPPRKLSQQFDPISVYEDSVAAHLSKILHSDDHSVVISSAR
jgi:hypothetical protein